MTPAEGDRVRVTIDAEGVIQFVNASGRLGVRFDDDEVDVVEFIPARYVTVLRPLKVGDVVEARDQLDALPDYSIVRCDSPTGFAAQKIGGEWRAAFTGRPVDPMTWSRCPAVLHVGEPAE